METVPAATSSRPWYTQSRWLSAAEVALGAFIVIGHNVYRILPNEVPILFALGLISFQLRNGNWSAMGLKLPRSWRNTILLAVAAGTVRILLANFVVDPLTAHFWPPALTDAMLLPTHHPLRYH